jgi:predicted MPP superfamily phosphohydrolase/GTPase SAR1 family protein/predicted secreted protein
LILDFVRPHIRERMTAIRWLHLTDFHQGMNNQEWLWPTMRERLFEDLNKLHAKTGGPWDLVLFTGDLTQKGAAEEFNALEDMLAQLWEQFQSLGSNPLLLAVPGNHDLLRPNPKKGTVKAFARWLEDKDIRDETWSRNPNEYRSLLDDAFKPYTDWQHRSKLHAKGIHTGLLPGDFAFSFEKNGSKLGIVGLNSAFLQLTGDDYKGRLELGPRQLQAVCDEDAPNWLAQHDATVLLTHHPQDWLHEDAKAEFKSEIFARDNFTIHLFGHMHVGASESMRRGGGPKRLSIQGPSLFGLEYSGESKRAKRKHGYNAGQIDLKEAECRLSFWPRTAVTKQDGYLMLGADPSEDLDENESWSETLARKRVRSGRPLEPKQSLDQKTPPPTMEDKGVRPRPGRPPLSAGDYLRLHGRARETVARLSAIGNQLGWLSIAQKGEELLEVLQQEPYRVVITGKSRAGKSTLLNAMVGRDICPAQRTLTTAVPIVISPSEKEFVTIDFEKGSPVRIDGPVTKDMLAPYADQRNNRDNEKGVREIRVELADEVLNLGVKYVDIPGFDDPSNRIWSATDEAIQLAHALILVVDASTFSSGGFALDKKTIELLQKAKERNCPAFVICNKSESLSLEDRKAVTDEVHSTLDRYDVWTTLRYPPFLLSASAASTARGRKEPAPPEYEQFHDALWKSLWNTETIGVRRLHNVFEQLQTAREELAALIAFRRAQEPDRVRLQQALNRCIDRWNKVYHGCKDSIENARQRAQNLCKDSAAEFRMEIKSWVASLPGGQDLPKNSDAVDSLKERILSRWQSIFAQVGRELEEKLSPLDHYMRKGLAELVAEIGSSPQDKQTNQLLAELYGWKAQMVMPNPKHPGRYVGAISGSVVFGLMTALMGPAGTIVSAIASAAVSYLSDRVANHVESPDELEKELIRIFDKQWAEFEAQLKRQISGLGQSLEKRTRARMNPFVEDMKRQLDNMRDVSEEELKLFDGMTLEIQDAMAFLHAILRESATTSS